jgi:plasmid stability protein
MATIQIRNVPDDVHRVYRRRAAEAGMSLQEFLRDEGSEGFSSVSSADVIRADRESH